ncbi:MAG: type II 3-dehydroquinate dehydratase [Actinomycetota bacterium]|nr:type II 3-dehydroquinate dehydratase [Actinomycetota bacterium]MDD5666043.1 type II 3-dehydroquinate dehydratase [Actinomycetota bacterium]
MAVIAVVNGPNLNMLGGREPEVYGTETWQEIRGRLEKIALDMGLELDFFQSNHEGALVDHVQEVATIASGMIINPGALTHYGYSLRDAVAALSLPVIEVHITNIFAREEWRSRSVVSPVVRGVISGLGAAGYELALLALAAIVGGEDR